MEKPTKVAEILIENQWLNNIITFMRKAYNINEESFKLIVNGSKPELSENAIKKFNENASQIIANPEENKEEEVKE